MSVGKDFIGTNKKAGREVITPHRLSVAILIREFCKIRETSEPERKCIRDFCILSLRLIQSPDYTLDELQTILSSGEYYLGDGQLLENFNNAINSVVTIGIRQLLDIVGLIGCLMTIDNNVVNKGGVVNKNSIIGYYLRRFVVNFDKLTFSEVKSYFSAFKVYVEGEEETSFQKDFNSSNGSSFYYSIHSKFDNSENTICCTSREWSRRQAELFIATQSALFTNNNVKAMSPKELKEQIESLLKSNPDLSEAHFLNSLNYMRVKDFFGAIDSLYNCFDKSASVECKGTSEDKPKSYRFAVLNLAILHFQFNHKEEALAALKEAINVAQEASDNICLQYALAWLYCLTNNNRHKLMEHSILKSLDLNLSYIMSLGLQSFVQYAGITMGNPKQVFDTITKSDVINCQHSHRDLISNSYAQKSAIWLFYGKPEMSLLWSQLLVYFNADSSITKTYYGEGYCQALCNIAGHLFEEGEYEFGNSVLALAKERFPDEPISFNWMLVESIFNFKYLLLKERYGEVEIEARKIAVVDQLESSLRMVEYLIHIGDYAEAHSCINQILDKCKEGPKKIRMDIQVRAMILLTEIQTVTSFPDRVIPGVLGLLNSSLAYANDYNLQYFAAIAQLHIAHIMLLTGLPEKAMEILDRCFIQIMSHGGAYDRARARILYVKCMISNANAKTLEEKEPIMLEAIKMLENSKKDFEKVEAYFRVKEVLMLQSLLYNDLNRIQERNECAIAYKILEKSYESKCSHNIALFL